MLVSPKTPVGAKRACCDNPELYWFVRERVLVVAIHVVGSHDNAAVAAEQVARAVTNRASLGQALAAAGRNQARPRCWSSMPIRPSNVPGCGLCTFSADLDRLRRDFAGPILAIHGASHRYYHPLTDPATGAADARFTRLQVPGSPFVGGVWVMGDPEATPAFAVELVHPVSRAPLMPDG